MNDLSDVALKKKGRGSYEEHREVVDGVEVIVVKWYDNRAVTVVSTFVGAQPTSSIERWDRSSKAKVDVVCPNAISTYSKSMGGVDLLDALISFYRIHLRPNKYYHRLFFHFVDMAIVIGWLLYRRGCRSLPIPKRNKRDLLSFKTSIAEALCKQGKDISLKKRG